MEGTNTLSTTRNALKTPLNPIVAINEGAVKGICPICNTKTQKDKYGFVFWKCSKCKKSFYLNQNKNHIELCFYVLGGWKQ